MLFNYYNTRNLFIYIHRGFENFCILKWTKQFDLQNKGRPTCLQRGSQYLESFIFDLLARSPQENKNNVTVRYVKYTVYLHMYKPVPSKLNTPLQYVMDSTRAMDEQWRSNNHDGLLRNHFWICWFSDYMYILSTNHKT